MGGDERRVDENGDVDGAEDEHARLWGDGEADEIEEREDGEEGTGSVECEDEDEVSEVGEDEHWDDGERRVACEHCGEDDGDTGHWPLGTGPFHV